MRIPLNRQLLKLNIGIMISRLNPDGQKYHRFLTATPPQELHYNTRMKASGNIDDTPEKETVILMTIDTKIGAPNRKWTQAFLCVAEAETEATLPEKIDPF